jgi:hypothetical protein
MLIDLAKTFSPYPSGRVIGDATFNGEKFRTEHLDAAIDAILASEQPYEDLTVDIDGVRSFGSSFLEEAFGGLIRLTKHDPETVAKVLKIRCTQGHLKMYHDAIIGYIEDALKQRQATT